MNQPDHPQPGSTAGADKAALARRYLQAFPAGDRATIEQALAPDFHFTSPYDDHIDRAEYFRRCWPNHDKQRSIAVEKVLAQGDEAFVTYLCTTTDGRQFRNTEFWTFRGEQMVEVRVYFGESYRDGKFVAQQAA